MQRSELHKPAESNVEFQEQGLSVLAGTALLAGIIVTSFFSYLLFHSLAELFSIVIACGIFVIAWNARSFLDNNYLLFIGIAYLFTSGIELTHTLAYKGMGVFPKIDANPATQLWIAARTMQSISLLLAPLFIGRRLRYQAVFAVYAVVAALLIYGIFATHLFPDCYREGSGLTRFKKFSEYAISCILILSGFLLFRKKDVFEVRVLRLIVLSITAAVLAELSFAFYADVYDLFNLLGHVFHIISFALMYAAIIRTGLQNPDELIFRNLKESRKALNEQYSILHGVNENINAPIFSVDSSYRYTSFNKMHGAVMKAIYGAEIKVGDSLLDCMTVPADRETAKKNLDRALAGEQLVEAAYSGEESLAKKYFEVSHNPIRTDTGEVIGAVVMAKDMTEQKHAEETLRKSETEFKEAQRIAHIGSWDWDATSDTISWSDEYYRIYSLDPRLPTPNYQEHMKIYTAESSERLQKAVTKALRTGEPYELDLEMVRPDGSRGWITARGEAKRDGNGKITGLHGTAIDITERKRAEEEAQCAGAYNRSLIEASLDPLVTIGPDGTITDVNAATEKVTGCFRKELIGRDFSDYFTEPEQARAGYQQVFREGAVRDYPLEIKDREGRITPVLYNATVYRDALGKVIGVFAAARDITERKKAEAEARLNQARRKALLDLYQKMPAASVPHIISFVVERCANLTESAIGFVGLISDDNQHMKAHLWSEQATEECSIGKPLHFPLKDAGIWAEAIRQRRTMIINDYAAPHPLKRDIPRGMCS